MTHRHPHIPIPLRTATLASALACMAVSCTNSSHLLLYQHSSLGMNTGVNPANQNVHVRIGARSEFAAVIPKYKVRPEPTKDGETPAETNFEAASAYFGSRFRVTSIWKIPEAAQVLVTGNAAVIAASGGRLRLEENHDQPVASTPTGTQEQDAGGIDTGTTPNGDTVPSIAANP